MDIVNFPGIIAEHGLLKTNELSLADDLLLIGKKMGKQRDGTQYENMAVTLQELANLIAIAGGNETLNQTLILGNTTGGVDIIVSATDTINFASGAFFGDLSRIALTANHSWALPNQSGTIALLSDIPAAGNTIYTGDGSTLGARNIQLGGTLTFNHGAAGVNGYVQTVAGGLFRNQTSIATNYFEYNNLNGILLLNSDTHSVTGFRANNTGGVNPTSLVEMVAGSNGTAYINIGPTTSQLDFYVNNTGKLAGSILGGSGAFNGSWGFGINATPSAKVHIYSESGQGFGTIIQSGNLSPAESILQVRDAANVTHLAVSATGITTISDRVYIGYLLGSVVSAAAVIIKGSDSAFASVHNELFDGSNNQLWVMRNNGNIGVNIAPNAADRMYLRAGAGYDGGINISASNLANGGYGILVQGGTGGATYNGIWSDASGGGTGIVRSFYGQSGAVAGTQNFGGHFSARNGSTWSIGVYGLANGGDSVTPTDFAAGVWGEITCTQADDRRAAYFNVGQAAALNNSITYGNKIEVNYVSGVVSENIYGIHIDAAVDGASATNIAAYLTATGGGSENYALITDNGFVVFGALTNANGSLIEVSGDLEIIGDVDGIVVEDRTLATRHRIFLNSGVISLEAA